MQQSSSQYCSVEDVKLLPLSGGQLTLFHANIRSIQKNFIKLYDLLCDISVLPDIIALSETWVSKTSFFKPNLPGYNYVFTPTTSNRSGGVAFFIKETIQFQINRDLNFKCASCENLFVKLHLSNNKTVIVGVIYRHPGYNYTDFLNCFEKLLYNLNLSNKTYFVCGDFNINYSKQQENSVYINSIASTGCQQLITNPTRIKSAPNKSSLLDHLYTNHLTDQILVKIISHDLTDHLPFIAVIENHPPKTEAPSKYKKRDMRNFNQQEFLDYLSLHVNSISSLDGNEFFDLFIDVFSNSINKFAPLRSLTKREIKLKAKPWISTAISKLIRKKNRLYKKFVRSKTKHDQRVFKAFSNHLNHIKEKSRRKHYDNVIRNSSKNSKLIWKTVNDIVNLKDKKGSNIKLITSHDGKSISDPIEISKEFNAFFASIGQSTSNSIPSNVPFSLSLIFQKIANLSS